MQLFSISAWLLIELLCDKHTICQYNAGLNMLITQREGNIWHNLAGNTMILFFNPNIEYMNNKQIY